MPLTVLVISSLKDPSSLNHGLPLSKLEAGMSALPSLFDNQLKLGAYNH